MDSLRVPAGPEAAPTLPASQFVTSPTLIPQLNSSGTSAVSPASATSIVALLSLITLTTFGTFGETYPSEWTSFTHIHNEAAVICWIRRRWTIAKVSDGRPWEMASVCDIEALAPTRPFVPVTSLSDVRWTPQIRSISGPVLDKAPDRKSAPLQSKRARSPPPSSLTKPGDLFPDPSSESAPAPVLLFSQNKTPYSEKSSREGSDLPMTRALAVSGLQTRSLETSGWGQRASGVNDGLRPYI